MKHELKTWPVYFNAIRNGRKTFEVRKDDRGFTVGDTLVLLEYNKDSDIYSGRSIKAQVTYILRGPAFGVEEGFCVMAIKVFEKLAA